MNNKTLVTALEKLTDHQLVKRDSDVSLSFQSLVDNMDHEKAMSLIAGGGQLEPHKSPMGQAVTSILDSAKELNKLNDVMVAHRDSKATPDNKRENDSFLNPIKSTGRGLH